MNLKVISYYCDVDDSRYYEKSYHRLKEQLDKYGYDYHIEKLDSLGSYKENCRRKIDFIIEKFHQFDENILWLDVDTNLLNPMTQLEYINSDEDLDVDILFASGVPELIGIKASPIWFKNNKKSLDFLLQWKTAIDNSREQKHENFDHEVLFQTVADTTGYCKFGLLGYEYCTWPGNTNENTVIEMGLSDVESKKESLRKMGFDESKIEWQSVGLNNE